MTGIRFYFCIYLLFIVERPIVFGVVGVVLRVVFLMFSFENRMFLTVSKITGIIV